MAVARSTASRRLLAPSLETRFRMWNSIVFSLRYSARAISEFLRPVAD
jgi:hypothetical protein